MATLEAPADVIRQTERAWQRTVEEAARWLGYRTFHVEFSFGSVRGFPDLIIMGKGRVVFAELKSERGKTTADQDEWLTFLDAEGLESHLWRPSNWDDVIKVLSEEAG